MDKRLTRRVLEISLPMVVSELCDSIYSIADTYFVSGLGVVALASVGVASYLVWLSFVLATLFYTGVIVYASQAYGAREYEKARRALGETIGFGIVAGFTASAILILLSRQILLILTGSPGPVLDYAVLYYCVRIAGFPIVITAWSLDGFLRAIGCVRESMAVMLSSTVLNIVLDPILIYGYGPLRGFGIAGAALATLIAIVYIAVIELCILYRKGFYPDIIHRPRHIRRILDIGLPTAFERALMSIGSNIYIALVSRCGEVALAAHNIGLRIESFIYMPGFAFMIAASTLVGQEIGRGDIESAKRIGWETIRIGTLVMALLGLIVALTSRYLVKPFSPTPGVEELASLYLVIAGLSEAGLGLNMVVSGAIRGSGNTRIPLLVNAPSVYIARVIPGYILMGSLGVVGVWIGMFIDVYTRGIVLTIIYHKYFYRITKRVI